MPTREREAREAEIRRHGELSSAGARQTVFLLHSLRMLEENFTTFWLLCSISATCTCTLWHKIGALQHVRMRRNSKSADVRTYTHVYLLEARRCHAPLRLPVMLAELVQTTGFSRCTRTYCLCEHQLRRKKSRKGKLIQFKPVCVCFSLLSVSYKPLPRA